MKKGSITAIFFGLWIVLMFLLYWSMEKKSIIENIIYLVIVGSGFALVLWLRMRQIPQKEAVIRNRKIERSTIEIIENTAAIALALWGISMFWLYLFLLLPSEVSLRNILLAIGLIALIILGKLYRKYKDRVILVIMIIVVLLLLGGFLLIL